MATNQEAEDLRGAVEALREDKPKEHAVWSVVESDGSAEDTLRWCRDVLDVLEKEMEATK